MVNKRYLSLITFLADVTQKILSHPLSHRQPSLFTQANDHDVEPSRGRSSLTTGPIHPINPPLPSPHRRPSPRRLLRTNQTCLCPPLTVEVSNALRHRDTLRQLPAPTAEAALLYALPTNPVCSSAAPYPSIRWDGTLVCTAEVQRHRRDPAATLFTSRWGFHCLRVAAQTCTIAHNNQRWACLFIFVSFLSWFVSYFDLFCFVWLALFRFVDVDLLMKLSSLCYSVRFRVDVSVLSRICRDWCSLVDLLLFEYWFGLNTF